MDVLLVDDDPFEARYIKAALEGRAVRVLGPIADPELVLTEIRGVHVRAAIVGLTDVEAGRRLLMALERGGASCLALTRPVLAGEHTAVLARPFAAYQVLEWALKTLNRA